MRLRCSLLVLATLLWSLPATFPALAQTTETPALNTTGLIQEVMSTAEDHGMQVIVIDAGSAAANTIDPVLEDGEQPDFDAHSMLMKIQSDSLVFRDSLKRKVSSLPNALSIAHQNLLESSPTGSLKPYFGVLYWSVFLLLVGMLFEHHIFNRLIIGRRLERRVQENPIGYRDKLPLLALVSVIRLVGVVISMGVAYLIGSALFRGTPPETIQFSIAIVYAAYAAIRIAGILWQSILAPKLCQYRIPHFSNADANRLFYWLWFTSGFNISAIMFGIWIGVLAKNNDVDAFLTLVFGGLVALFNTLLVIFNRKAISRAIRNGKPVLNTSGPLRFLSIVWFPASVIYFIFSWLHMTWLLVVERGLVVPLIAGAYGILVAVIFVYAVINYAIDRFFYRQHVLAALNTETTDSVPEGETSEFQGDEELADDIRPQSSLRTYEDLARRVAGILAVLAGIWSLTKIWNVQQVMALDTYLTQSLDVMVILFIGYIIYHAVRIWIDNKIIEEGGEEVALAPGDEGGASSASRLATLLPLFRNFMLVVVALSVVFSAFMELGINLSPLFASAGVVGLAIGFGAQTLVRDIFSGAFYLFDDAFRKGEYVDIGSVKGTVEKISVRSFQLRHHLGPLHTIPFGEIQVLTNYSRDWVMMKLPLRLTYDTDVEQVRKLIKKLGQELLTDPEIGHTFLQPLKSQGVLEMQDSAMIVRVKFMAKPGDQWVIRKRVYQEIRDLFEREGISFAHREVTVRIASEDAQNLSGVQKQALAAAALGDEVDEENDQGGADDR
ncbi:MAG: mechanosensitive ion channel family protein [Granulosicoccus sp.]|nr:mechanosensitive ion channel family protein [Granulosicoccus sp.]